MTWLFLESTAALAGAAFVVMFALLVYWRRTLRRRPFQIGAAAFLVLFIIQGLVVTKKEHAGRILHRVETAVRESSPEILAGELSERFTISETGWSKEQYLEVVRRYMSWMEVNSLIRRKLEMMESDEDSFSVYVSYFGDVKTRSFTWTGISRWEISFVRDEDGWRISDIQPYNMGQYPVRSWRAIPAPR